MIAEITEAALAPFLQQVGWQGFAYGLLGLKTIKKSIRTIKNMRTEDSKNDDD